MSNSLGLMQLQIIRFYYLCCCWRCPRSSGDCPGKMKGKIPWRWSGSVECCFLSPKFRIEENCPARKKRLVKLILNSGPWRERSGRLFMLKMDLHLLGHKPCCKVFIWLESSGLIEQVSLGNFIPGRLFMLSNFVCGTFSSTSYLYPWWIETFYKWVGSG